MRRKCASSFVKWLGWTTASALPTGLRFPGLRICCGVSRGGWAGLRSLPPWRFVLDWRNIVEKTKKEWAKNGRFGQLNSGPKKNYPPPPKPKQNDIHLCARVFQEGLHSPSINHCIITLTFSISFKIWGAQSTSRRFAFSTVWPFGFPSPVSLCVISLFKFYRVFQIPWVGLLFPILQSWCVYAYNRFFSSTTWILFSPTLEKNFDFI